MVHHIHYGSAKSVRASGFLNRCIGRPTLENFSKLLKKNDRVCEIFILRLKYSPRSAS